jgi:transposase-like protein
MKFIYIDVTQLKIRGNGIFGNKVMYVFIGIDSDGRMEILSSQLCDSETLWIGNHS